jgi:hypothetical protein
VVSIVSVLLNLLIPDPAEEKRSDL